jgi:hypothetical protein
LASSQKNIFCVKDGNLENRLLLIKIRTCGTGERIYIVVLTSKISVDLLGLLVFWVGSFFQIFPFE